MYLIKKILSFIFVMFLIVTITFFLLRLAPGDPFTNDKITPEAVLNLKKKYNLDKPILIQYINYLTNLVTKGDMGYSYALDRKVNYYIGLSFPVSMLLGFLTLILAVFFGILTGVAAAFYKNSPYDYIIMTIVFVGISVPVFVISPILQFVFAIKIKFLPISGWITEHGIKSLFLPVLSMFFTYFATIASLIRTSTLEILKSDYIRTARAKGLSWPTIIFKHSLRGAILPVVSFLGPALAAIITGSIVIESIFNIPGFGSYVVNSAFNRDYPMILGGVIVYSFVLILMNTIVDILYRFIDPRMKKG